MRCVRPGVRSPGEVAYLSRLLRRQTRRAYGTASTRERHHDGEARPMIDPLVPVQFRVPLQSEARRLEVAAHMLPRDSEGSWPARSRRPLADRVSAQWPALA